MESSVICNCVVGWMASPKIYIHPELQNVTLLENRVFEDVIS